MFRKYRNVVFSSSIEKSLIKFSVLESLKLKIPFKILRSLMVEHLTFN